MRPPNKPARVVSLPKPANDNGVPRTAPRVSSDWPSIIEITTAELCLLETHMADLVSEIAANDNEPPESEESP